MSQTGEGENAPIKSDVLQQELTQGVDMLKLWDGEFELRWTCAIFGQLTIVVDAQHLK